MMKQIFKTIFIIIAGLYAFWGINVPQKVSNWIHSPSQAQQQAAINFYQEYLNVPMGADYEIVKTTMGTEGKLDQESGSQGMRVQTYKFETNRGFALMMFTNGRLVGKALSGAAFFGKPKEKITTDQFHEIQTGMTYDQVKEIFKRNGIMQMKTNMGGVDSTTFVWMNPDESYITIMFINGIADSISQSNL